MRSRCRRPPGRRRPRRRWCWPARRSPRPPSCRASAYRVPRSPRARRPLPGSRRTSPRTPRRA
ncbi:hypothetical protein C3486_35265 [Streptomyces sp. Ru73]|nr:hypothetical protein C3486_35265 [Streptomyces sp. Ru73]